MISPFDCKNKVAAALDRAALRLLLLVLCVGYFFFLWRSGWASLLAGTALYSLLRLTLMLLERRTLHTRERLLRQRVGGIITTQALVLMPSQKANETVCTMLCDTLGAQRLTGSMMRYGGETWLVRCVQCMQGASVGEGDVLAAHRARVECGADKCVLASTALLSPAATRTGEWMDPPVRLISGRQLAAIAGQLHPATDEEIARHMQRQRTPFRWQRIRALALSPAKLPRYLLCAGLLLMMYMLWGSLFALAACLMAFLLAIFCARENQRTFRL